MKDQTISTNQINSGPKLFAWLASISLLLLIILSQFLTRGYIRFLRIIGVVSLLIAPVFIFTPFFLLSKHGRSKVGESYLQTGKFVNQGLYAVIRHPQYLGYILLAIGFGLLSQNWLALLLGMFSIVCFYIQGIQEERYCLAQFGEPYKGYLQQVPCFNFILGFWRIWRGKNND